MQIKDHKIDSIPYIPSPNNSGLFSKAPTLLVLHYTASGGSAKSIAEYFSNRKARASAHLVIGRQGEIYQCVPFNKKAWHAGKSFWKGRSGCNNFSIGIELNNWGLLTRRADGNFYSWSGKQVPPSEVIYAKNKLGHKGYWHVYTKEQINALEEVCDLILESYPTIGEIVGHEDISPKRKLDPGPALYDSIRKLNNKIGEGRADCAEHSVTKKVIASALNVRQKPTTRSEIVETLPYGTLVDVSYDAGSWSKIKEPLEGWVYDKYLE